MYTYIHISKESTLQQSLVKGLDEVHLHHCTHSTDKHMNQSLVLSVHKASSDNRQA